MFERIVSFLESSGYWGIVLLMFAENVFPPIPSELIMPFAGFTASNGNLHIVGVIMAGTAGSLLGAIPWYWAGRALGLERIGQWADRHGEWLTLSRDDVEGSHKWFQRHCGKAVLLGRLVPGVRTLISVPAGITKMAIKRFVLFTVSGSAIWNSALAFAGFKLGERYEEVARYMDPMTKGVLALLVAAYIYRVWKQRQAKRRS